MRGLASLFSFLRNVWFSIALLTPILATAGTTWDGGGATTSWGTLANWNPDGLPLFNGLEQITIGSGITSGATLTLDGTRYIDSLLINTTTAFTLGAGTGGTLNLRSGNLTRTSTPTVVQTISAGIVLGDPTGAAAYSGTWNLAGTNNFIVSGNISEAGGSRSLTKSGNANLTLSGNNSFSGGLTINAGNVLVSTDANLGASTGGITLNGGNLYAQGSFTGARALTINAASIVSVNPGCVMELSGLVSGNGNLLAVGSGTLILSGSGSNGTGTTSITNGVLAIRNGVTLGSGLLSIQNGVLELGSGDFTRSFGFGAGQVNMNTTTSGGGFAAWGADRIVNLGGSGATLAWGDTNFVSTGPLRFGSTTGNATVDFQNGLNLGGVTRTIQLVRGTGVNADAKFSGLLSNGGLTLDGVTGSPVGRLLLSNGNNSYSAYTSIYGGSLWVSANATSGAGNTVLGGGSLPVILGNSVGVFDASLMTAAPVTINRDITVVSGNTGIASVGGVTAHSSTYTGNVALGSGTAAGKNLSLTAAAGGTVTFSGIFSDPAGLTGAKGVLSKDGAGTVVLSGANTYSGATIVNNGGLNLRNAAALGGTAGGTTVNNGGELQLQGNIAVGSELLTLNGTGASGSGALRNMSGSNSWAGNITLASSALIQSLSGQLTLSGILSNGGNGADFSFDGAGNTLVTGSITNNADVIKNGTGLLTLQGANTYTGGTFVNGGTLRLTGSLNGSAGTALTFGGDSTFNFNRTGAGAQGMGALSFAAGHANVQSTYGGSGNTSLTFSSLGPRGIGATGNFVVSGGTNGTTNKIVLTGQPAGFINAAFFFNYDDFAYVDPTGYVRAINYGVDPGTAVSPGGTSLSGDHVKANGHITSQGTQRFETLHIAGNYDYTIGANQKVTVGGILKTGNEVGSATISGGDYLQADPNAEMVIGTARENDFLIIETSIIANGTNAVTKTGAGTLTLSGTNTYTGGTYVTAGTLRIGANERLLNSGALTVGGGTFDLQNFTETVGTVVLSSGAISGSGTGTLIGSSYDVRSGSASAILAGPSSLTKNTDGTVTLTGANTYTGTTTVNAGQLVAAAPSGSALGSTTALIVNPNGNVTLGANNQINNAAPVTLAGGTFSTGGFSEGTASSAGAGALNLTATGSAVDFGTGATGTLAFSIFNPGSYSLTIDNWTGTPGVIGDGTTDQLIFATDPTPNLGSFNFTGYQPGGLAVLLPSGFYEVTPALAPVPEINPTAAAVLVCLLGLLGMKRSRRELRRLIFGCA